MVEMVYYLFESVVKSMILNLSGSIAGSISLDAHTLISSITISAVSKLIPHSDLQPVDTPDMQSGGGVVGAARILGLEWLRQTNETNLKGLDISADMVKTLPFEDNNFDAVLRRVESRLERLYEISLIHKIFIYNRRYRKWKKYICL